MLKPEGVLFGSTVIGVDQSILPAWNWSDRRASPLPWSWPLSNSSRAFAIISAIVALARAFDVTVVGEGVETEEQLEALAAAGCDFAQGFLLGRPVDADAIADLLLTDP